MSPKDIWKEHFIKPDISQWSIGPVQLLFHSSNRDILVHHSEEQAKQSHKPKLSETQEEIKWQRWCFESHTKSLTIYPIMPNRPLLVYTSDIINLPAKARITLYVSIPITVKVFVKSQNKENILCKIPSEKLSNSWFGSNTEGEICYALKSPAQREINELEWSDHTAICPIEIYNDSEEPFKIERLCIRPRFFNIYASTMRLWTDRALITYRGEKEISKIEYPQSPPSEITEPIKLVEAEELLSNSIFKRTFNNLVSTIT